MTTTYLLGPAAAAFAVAAVLFVGWLLRYQQSARRGGAMATVAGTVLMVAAIALELSSSAAPTLGQGPRVMLIVVGGVCLLFLLTRLRSDMPLAGPVIAPLAAAATFALAVKSGQGLVHAPTGPSLGAVTILHIGATLLGFMCFLPAYVLSVLFLDQEYRLRTKKTPLSSLPSLLKMEQLAWRLVYVGFPLFSVGILLGLVWSERSATLEIKPQHLLAATAWAIYGYATARHLKTGWRGRRAALTLMAGFVVTLAAVLLYTMR